MSWFRMILASRTFALVWAGLLFAVYGGIARNHLTAEQFWPGFAIAYFAIVASGYLIGTNYRDRMYRSVIAELIGINHQMAEKLVAEGLIEPPHVDGTCDTEDRK